MAISTHTEQFTYPGELDRPLIIHKSKTLTGNDICFSDGDYNYIHDTIRFSDAVNLLDYQSLSEHNMSCYTRHALELLPKKDILIITYVAEALNSTYWNVVLDIVYSFGYKEVIWVDGGLTAGYLYRHLSNLRVSHRTGTMFFNTLLRDGIGLSPTPEQFTQRSKYFLSLARLARRERIYFTDKLLHDKDLASKGIYSCGWGEDYINKRCDMVFNELKRLVQMHSLEAWNTLLNQKLQHRLLYNFNHMKELGNNNHLTNWINSRF